LSEVVKLEHGGGGSMMRELIENVFISKYGRNRVKKGVGLPDMDDGATIPIDGKHLVFSTDATTVRPLFFPGGDIGKLAIFGAVNDLSMMGAEPLALSSAFIIEEGVSFELLKRVVYSINDALEEVEIPISAGDTKVVEKGGVDQLLIASSGIGISTAIVTDSGLCPGDKIILTGTIGNHQLALLSIREGLELETSVKSDVAPLLKIVKSAIKIGGVTSMKDPTRGGVSGALNDMARKSAVDVILREEEIPIQGAVRSASELLGLDPLELANEGIAIMGVKPDSADEILKTIKRIPNGRNAAIVGEVVGGKGLVIKETFIGGRTIVREPVGSPMPRIC
jgi:hydrogenase expression/formation protein HypE